MTHPGSSSFSAIRALAARVFSLVVGIALVWTVTRELNTQDAGQFLLLLTIANVLSTLGRFGTDNLVLKLLGSPSPRPETPRILLRICIVSASAVSAISLAFGTFMADALDIDVRPTLIMMGAILPLAVSVYFGAVLRSSSAMARGVLVENGLQSALAIALTYALNFSSLTAMTVGYGSSCIAVAILAASWARHGGRMRQNCSDLPSVARVFLQHRRTLGSMTGVSVLFYASTYAPTLVLGAARDYDGLAAFTIATRIAGFVGLIPILRSSYLAPSFARLHQSGKYKRLNALAERVAVTDTVVAIAVAVVIVVARDEIVGLFGSTYSGAASLVTILAAGGVATVAQGQVNPLALTCGYERSALALSLGTAATWFVTGLPTALIFEAGGTALLVALISTTYAIGLSVRLRRLGGITSSPFVRVVRARNAFREKDD